MLKSYLKTVILIFICIELGQTQAPPTSDHGDVKPPTDEDEDLKVVVTRLKEDLEKTKMDMMKLIQDLQTKVNTMEGSLKTVEENVVHLQTKISTMEGSFNTMEENCGQECDIRSHNCSENANCIDTCGHYKCSCLAGYSGDGFICEDVDECQQNNKVCGDEQICTNLPGNYTCTTCQEGYKKKGNICQVSGCISPAHEIPGLGCLIPVEEELSWDDAQLNCQRIGARLAEGIKSEHLEMLQKHFNHKAPGDYVHIGYRGGVWVTSKEPPVDPQGNLWGVTEPDGTDKNLDNCGVTYLPKFEHSFYDYTCAYTFSSLCQII